MTNEEERDVRRKYSKLKFLKNENDAIYDCYMQGINRDGHVWVTWTDVEKLLCDLFKGRNDNSVTISKKVHEVKILPEYYEAVNMRLKNFEVRNNDRDYHIGDEIVLKEWDGKKYTGRKCKRTILYMLNDDTYLKEGYVVLELV